ncbi:MAG: pirin family protein [Deltaproteobacteria bacterium]|nr:pirin family protein [Deltaproteobacteria bacterium]
MRVRRSHERGHANHGWLDSHHTFSFANYYDPDHMGFRTLRVINDDRVLGGAGFGTHPHRDMEIISYVVEGALEHKDSMGTGSVIRPGDVQLMRAGTGVTHSEYNHSPTDTVRFLQIWITPDQNGLTPGYEQKFFGDERRGTLRLVASPDGADDAVQIHQNVTMYASILEDGQSVTHEPANGRHTWLQIVRGNVTVEGVALGEGDGASFSDASPITIQSDGDGELILFDLA